MICTLKCRSVTNTETLLGFSITLATGHGGGVPQSRKHSTSAFVFWLSRFCSGPLATWSCADEIDLTQELDIQNHITCWLQIFRCDVNTIGHNLCINGVESFWTAERCLLCLVASMAWLFVVIVEIVCYTTRTVSRRTITGRRFPECQFLYVLFTIKCYRYSVIPRLSTIRHLTVIRLFPAYHELGLLYRPLFQRFLHNDRNW